MSCPHSRREDAKPETCSLCLGIAPRKVDQQAGLVLVDGIPARPIDAETTSASKYYGKRGGKAMHATKGKRT